MARTKMVDGVVMDFTPEEETQADAEELAWTNGAAKRDATEEIHRLESTVTPRRIREMTTADGAKWVDDVEKLIAIERAKL